MLGARMRARATWLVLAVLVAAVAGLLIIGGTQGILIGASIALLSIAKYKVVTRPSRWGRGR